MKFISLIVLITFFCSCTATYVRYTNLPHVENVQRIKVISKSKLKYEVLKHWSPDILRDTIINYRSCKDIAEGKQSNDSCLIYLEKKHVIQFRGSYYIKSSAWVNYLSQEKYKKYINKDIKF